MPSSSKCYRPPNTSSFSWNHPKLCRNFWKWTFTTSFIRHSWKRRRLLSQSKILDCVSSIMYKEWKCDSLHFLFTHTNTIVNQYKPSKLLNLGQFQLLCPFYFPHPHEHLQFLLMRSLLYSLHRRIPLLQHLIILLQNLQLLLDYRPDHAFSDEHMAFLFRCHWGSVVGLVALLDQFVEHSVDQQSHLYRFHILNLLIENFPQRRGVPALLRQEVGQRLYVQTYLVLIVRPWIGGVERDRDLLIEDALVGVWCGGLGVLVR